MTGFSKARILIVDQRQESESALADILSREESFEVRLVNDWRHEMLLSQEMKADAVLCDGSMPWPDVLEFCRSLRANPGLTSMVFIFLGLPHGI